MTDGYAMLTLEPVEVYPEATFQRTIVSVVKEILNDAGRSFVVLEGFGLDVATFLESKVRFFEVKAFGGQRPGSVGFGDRAGQGKQVDLLLCEDKSLPLLTPSSVGSMQMQHKVPAPRGTLCLHA
jgi:hypothetical protein